MTETLKTFSPDLKALKPYGSALDDGKIQLSFTLPIPNNAIAIAAAKLLAEKMGMISVQVAHAVDLGGFTFFVVYGSTVHKVDITSISVPEITMKKISRDEFDAEIKKRLGRRLVVIGACIGDDAHTVGIDAIMNKKGYAGHYGLESYHMIDVMNLGAQVSAETLIEKVREYRPDAVLASQVVTERDFHRENLSELSELLEAAGLRDSVVAICGGPRITHELALELGFDAGFGPGSYAEDVASFIFQKMMERGRL